MRLVSHNVTTAENLDEMARSKSGSSSCFLNSTQEGLGVGRGYDGSSLLNVPKLHHAVEIVAAELLGDVIDELFGFGCDRSPVITLRLSRSSSFRTASIFALESMALRKAAEPA
jgi:hypothetical protein